MPIPFDRFRYLNDTKKPVKVRNYSDFVPVEVEVDGGPVEVVPPQQEQQLPPDFQEVGVRRADENADPIEIALIILS
jgi:hypothetical protein